MTKGPNEATYVNTEQTLIPIQLGTDGTLPFKLINKRYLGGCGLDWTELAHGTKISWHRVFRD